MEYKYEYDEKGNIKTLNDGDVIYDYFYQDDLLVRISTEREKISSTVIRIRFITGFVFLSEDRDIWHFNGRCLL